jgi:hypothetical protein
VSHCAERAVQRMMCGAADDVRCSVRKEKNDNHQILFDFRDTDTHGEARPQDYDFTNLHELEQRTWKPEMK